MDANLALDPCLRGVLEGAEEVRAEEIGSDRGFTGRVLRVDWTRDGDSFSAVVKIPDIGDQFERCAREIRFYESIGPHLGARVPLMLGAHEQDDPPRVSLAMELIDGALGDAEHGCGPGASVPVLDVLASVHALGISEPAVCAHSWLPRWGQGTLGSTEPHRRRAARYRKRSMLLRERYGVRIGPILASQMDRLRDRFETHLESAAVFDTTLIHADVHLDNMIVCEPRSTQDDVGVGAHEVVLLDWQSVSAGPAAYDLVRFLLGALRGAEHQQAIPDLIDTYLDARRVHGAPVEDRAVFLRECSVLTWITIAGFVSGCAGMTTENTPSRLLRMMLRDLEDSGLPGAAEVVLGLASGRVE